MSHVLEHALIDSVKVFVVTFLIYIILSFFEQKFINLLTKHKKTAPIFGATAGLIPQCGISVVAADLYIKQHITLGTIFAVFFACSDEAIPVLISSGYTGIYVIPLILLKLVLGFSYGYAIDVIFKRSEIKQIEEVGSHSCAHHNHNNTNNDTKLYKHFIHPLIHTFEVFLYVLVVNIIFGFIVHLIGEDNILSFLSQSKYLTPLVCAIVGLIPNCSSSILLSELFILGGIPFGALFTGLCVNAGLGLVYLLKNRKSIKDILILIGLLLLTAIVSGYIIILIMNII